MKSIRTILKIVISIIIFNIILFRINALEILPKDDFAIDTTIIDQVEDYNLADSIVIAPLFLPDDMMLEEIELYTGLFYYQSVRLNQKDFLAHYFVTSDGLILEGNTKGDDQRFKLFENESKPIIIQYLTGSDSNDITLLAKNTLKQLLLQLANEQAIPLENIYIKDLKLYIKPLEPVLIKLSDLPGRWQASLKELVFELTPLYKPIPKNYMLSVEKVSVPDSPLVYPATIEATITIKNLSEHVLYQDTVYEPLISKLDNSPSKFYLNGIWLSQTQGPFMDEGSRIKPQESKTFTFKLQVPLYFGEITESYQLINSLGEAYTSTTFDVTLNVSRPEAQIVEITNTSTGQLNVRECPWASCEIIGRVTPGQRFIVLEKTDSGYLKLDLQQGKTGWVVSIYTKGV